MDVSVVSDTGFRAKTEATGPQAEWYSILRGTLYPIGHERTLSNLKKVRVPTLNLSIRRETNKITNKHLLC